MAEPATSDRFAQVKGFRVEIDGAGGKDQDVAWEHVSGGALIIENVETTVGADKFHTHAPGHKSVEDITLRGAMTDKRAALCQWLDDSQAKGPKPRRTVSITPLLLFRGEQVPRPGPTVVYGDCEIVGYTFPCLDARLPTGNVHEEVRIRPIRMDLR